MLVVISRELGVLGARSRAGESSDDGLGSLATIFVLMRVVAIPDDFFFAGRGVGIWISLASAVVIVAGLLQASRL